jgi:1-acyl-sn-glycerol-3-phosphate acyltransferase
MIVIGIIRLLLLLPTLFLGMVLTLLGGMIPVQIRGANLAQWAALLSARAFNRIMNVQVEVSEPERLRNHAGFIFPTHDTYMDIVLPVSVTPVRFVAAVEVKKIPFIGRMGTGFGVVYMDRRDKNDRNRVRALLRKEASYPPIVLYPEGMLDGKPGIAPFRYGAFELAQEAQKPYLLVAIVYDSFWNVKWKGETIYQVLWRHARTWKIRAKLIVLDEVMPTPADDPKLLAKSAERIIIRALAYSGYPDYAVVNENEEPVKPATSWENDPNA